MSKESRSLIDMIQWRELKSLEQFEDMMKESEGNVVMLFKHSIRCSTSKLMLDRLQRNWAQEEMSTVVPYFLDLITYREISNAIAEYFQIEHESPQVILINDRKAFYDGSHFDIEYQQLKKVIKS